MSHHQAGAGPERGSASGALAAAVANLLAQQGAPGCWEGEVAWNTMLLSQYVLACRMVGRWPLPERDRGQILRHYQAARCRDGSWPLHGEAPGSLFVTVLAYVALRVMGVPAGDPVTSAARRWLRAQPDSVTVLPSWGRMWLAMLGLYEYEGINPLVPETVLLPGWAPVHPDRLYVHTRMIYFGLSCLYAKRARFDLGPLTGELRAELYGPAYELIDWDTAFALRALLCAPATPQVRAAIGRGYRWLAGAQATEELPRRLRQSRDAVLGGWSFSDGTHRWPVSDCTAEALSAVLMVHRRADLHPCIGPQLPDARLHQAVEFILSRQNPDHGFGTYERTRGPAFLEKLNSTEMYAGCMTDFSHPEPTASCVAALARFRRQPGHHDRLGPARPAAHRRPRRPGCPARPALPGEPAAARHRRRMAPPGGKRRLLPDRRPGLPPVQRHLPHLGPRGRIHRIRLTSSRARNRQSGP